MQLQLSLKKLFIYLETITTRTFLFGESASASIKTFGLLFCGIIDLFFLALKFGESSKQNNVILHLKILGSFELPLSTYHDHFLQVQ